MDINKALNSLRNLTNSKFTQTELGIALGKTRSDIHAKAKRGTELKLSDIKKIEAYILDKYNLKIDLIDTKQIQNINNELIEVPVSGELSPIKSGIITNNESQSTYKISKELANDIGIDISNIQMILAQGDSMHPTIEDGDNLLIDTSKKEIYDGKIYCIKLNKRMQTKRLQIIPPDRIKVISDNKDKYDSFYIEGGFDFTIVGEVRWWGRVAR